MLTSCWRENGGSGTYMEGDLLFSEPCFGCRSVCERVTHFLFLSHFLCFFGSVFAWLTSCSTRACRRRTSCLSLLTALLGIFASLLGTLISSFLLSLSGSSTLGLGLGRGCGPSRTNPLVKPADEHIPAESARMRLDVGNLGSESSKLLSVFL